MALRCLTCGTEIGTMALRCLTCGTEIEFRGDRPNYCAAHHYILTGDEIDLVLCALRATVAHGAAWGSSSDAVSELIQRIVSRDP